MDEDGARPDPGHVAWGDADEVGEQLTDVLDLGVDGITVLAARDGSHTGACRQLGSVASKVLGR